MRKFFTLMLVTVSSISVAESQFEAYINPSEYGIYVLNKYTGGVKFCSTVDKDTLITACTEYSNISGYPLKKGEYNRWNRTTY